jgi:hypothetical protein
MTKEGHGDFLCIDERLAHDVGLGLMRGLAVMRTPVPLWFLQHAGQDHLGNLIVERPYGHERGRIVALVGASWFAGRSR